jgi:hypothetical protein
MLRVFVSLFYSYFTRNWYSLKLYRIVGEKRFSGSKLLCLFSYSTENYLLVSWIFVVSILLFHKHLLWSNLNNERLGWVESVGEGTEPEARRWEIRWKAGRDESPSSSQPKIIILVFSIVMWVHLIPRPPHALSMCPSLGRAEGRFLYLPTSTYLLDTV